MRRLMLAWAVSIAAFIAPGGASAAGIDEFPLGAGAGPTFITTLAPGVYRALISAKDATGNKSAVAKVGFRLKRR
jgi:hypothetical protein